MLASHPPPKRRHNTKTPCLGDPAGGGGEERRAARQRIHVEDVEAPDWGFPIPNMVEVVWLDWVEGLVPSRHEAHLCMQACMHARKSKYKRAPSRTHPSAVPTKRRRPSRATAADSTRMSDGLPKCAPTKGRTSKVLRAAGPAGWVVLVLPDAGGMAAFCCRGPCLPLERGVEQTTSSCSVSYCEVAGADRPPRVR